MRVLHVVGARPNFMKAAPVHAALAKAGVEQTLVHTGQHYDASMSDVFFKQLGMPEPDVNLSVGSGSHSMQTAEVMKRIEAVMIDAHPDWVLVYGDVNSTLAAALVAAKLCIRVAHVEAGLRSRDRSMPEEINRIVTDHVADLLFTPSEDGDENLRAEGIAPERIHRVGNVMIDTLVRLLPRAREAWPRIRDEFSLSRYALLTLHRPSNVDDPETLLPIVESLARISDRLPTVFPVHPRTRANLSRLGAAFPDSFRLTEPLGYLDFLALQEHAAVVITDSGGIQEETTFLGVPCLTMRPNTERPVTIAIGTNTLVGNDVDRLMAAVDDVLAGRGRRGAVPPLWDGHAAERIAAILLAGQ
jgi:UDP-N-acetylglucosamine 2-epimerase (non-hydrolysing)